MINNHKANITDSNDLSGVWKIQLTMRINFVSSLDPERNRIINSKSDNIEVNDIIKELLKSFVKRYQKNLEEKMKDSSFVFKSVNLLYYSLHKITLKRDGSYIKSPEWLRNKRAIINPKSIDNKFFRVAIMAALNYNEIPNHPERISKLMPFFNQYNWKKIEFPLHLKDWKKFEQNNKSTALNILFLKYNTKQIEPTYKSKYNCKRDIQVNLLMITDGINN